MDAAAEHLVPENDRAALDKLRGAVDELAAVARLERLTVDGERAVALAVLEVTSVALYLGRRAAAEGTICRTCGGLWRAVNKPCPTCGMECDD